MIPVVIHVAGPVIARRQECSRCGHILEGWTGSPAMAVAEPGQPAPTLPTWPVGDRIAVSGNATWVLGDDEPGPDVRECRPTS